MGSPLLMSQRLECSGSRDMTPMTALGKAERSMAASFSRDCLAFILNFLMAPSEPYVRMYPSRCLERASTSDAILLRPAASIWLLVS